MGFALLKHIPVGLSMLKVWQEGVSGLKGKDAAGVSMAP